jgi:hypothetical protein
MAVGDVLGIALLGRAFSVLALTPPGAFLAGRSVAAFEVAVSGCG